MKSSSPLSSMGLNGAQLSSSNVQQAVNINTLVSVLQAAGNTKFFSADFNGAPVYR
ncbi:hypothetical protein [Stutzerimonas nitrititolerans]|uniref:hypothetical protein n=1 Tax=Stutzerimonas nitrititolerans TaxID=2482751 RepID=UPI0028B21436|nr:hypothetical protein [Stutzerimonas nitrititolerans]